MQEIDIPLAADRNKRIAHLVERRLRFYHPVERLPGPYERDIAEIAAFSLLSLAGGRANADEHALDPFGREATREVNAVAPEPPDGVERHKDPLWRVHRFRQHCASNWASDAGRSSWMSLNALKAAR